MENNTCQNVGVYHPVDDFVCSHCGIHLQEWIRYVDDGDSYEIAMEYEFRYCPNCGREIVE